MRVRAREGREGGEREKRKERRGRVLRKLVFCVSAN